MFDQNLALQAMAVAAGVAAILLLALGWPWRNPWRSRLILGWTLGVGLGFFLGCLVLDVKLHPPFAENAEGTDRLLLVILPAVMVIECFVGFFGLPGWAAWPLRLLAAAGVAWMVLYNSTFLEKLPGFEAAEWTAKQQAQYLSVLGGSLLLVWAALDVLLHKTPGRSLPLALSVVSAGSAVTIMYSANLSGGLLALPLAGALAGGFVASFLLPASREGSGFLAVGLVILFGLLVYNRFFAQLTTLHGSLLFFSLLLCWLPEAPPLRKFRSVFRETVRVALVAIPVVLVVYQARAKFEEESRTSSSQPGEPTKDDYESFGK
ncbi:MAG: hypothetical protein ACJ8FY_06295 [Gemmataceae bacterium]